MRLRKLPAGHTFDPRDYYDQVPLGELTVYVREGRSSYALARLDGTTIVGGAAWVATSVLRDPEQDYTRRVLIHELGHAVGMFHPYESDNVTPLCSVIFYAPCSWFTDLDRVTPVDRLTARLAYSRLPGNDRTDSDPPPRELRGRSATERVLVPFDMPPGGSR